MAPPVDILGLGPSARGAHAPRDLLLVDDEPHVCAALKRVLHAEGYRIHVAHDRDQALAVLAREPIDVIVCDQHMPGARGTELLSEVRELYPNTIRMILSGAAAIPDVADAMSTGVIYKYLSKPIDPLLLRANVREAFQRATAQSLSGSAAPPPFDESTGLPTRQFLRRVFEELRDEARQRDETICLLLIKVDQYHNVVSSYGRAFSGSFVRAVAKRLTTRLSAAHVLCHDVPGTFIVLTSDHDPLQRIAGLDAELDELFIEPVETEGQSIAVTVSIGATSAGPHTLFDELLDQAHAAMVTGSDRGGATMQMYQPQLIRAFRGQLQLETDLRQALAGDAFEIHYQPQVDLRSRGVAGVEALLRWQHPRHGPIGPAEFIPMAERTGLIHDLGQWVLHRTLEQVAAWRRAGIAVPEIAINVSARQLRSLEFVQRVREALIRFSVPPHNLVLEITESVALDAAGTVVECLHELTALGVTLAIDDFGSGYANLTALTQLSISKVKLDRSLLPQPADPRGERLFTNIVSLARELNLETVAEGVETPAQLAAVAAARCPIVQGYLFSRPVTADELEPRLSAAWVPAPAASSTER